ncbi:MAG: hypothetical protein AAF611_17150 [Bacteroidota bacterium]
MKTVQLFACMILLTISVQLQAQTQKVDTNILVGEWKLDMSPQNATDANFAKMIITKVDENTFKGYFYREGVRIRSGRLNTQLGFIYGALVSGDNSGTYNTSFYYKDGKLYGSTHAIGREFLAVWTATKETK